MQLNRMAPPRSLISLVSMVDVLMIMLVFFMVTSTYLNLKMVPMAERADPLSLAPPVQKPGDGAATLLVRLGDDGIAHVLGQAQSSASLTALLQSRLADEPATQVIVLPSGRADTQSLVTLMENASMAGARRLRVIRLEPVP